MRKYYYLLLWIFILVSCSNDDDVKIAVDGELIANVDGTTFIASADNITVQYIPQNGSFPSKIRIHAFDNNGGRGIVLHVVEPEIGTFSLTNIFEGAAFYEFFEESPYSVTEDFSVEGILRISELDVANLLVSGSFNFEAMNINGEVIEIREGSFTNISMTERYDSTIGNTLSATIDGELFQPDIVSSFLSRNSIRISSTNIETNESVKLEIRATVDEDTYQFDTSVAQYFNVVVRGNVRTNSNNTFTSLSGSMEIVDYKLVDGVLSGTFQFLAGDIYGNDSTVVDITQGIFSVNIE